MRSQILKTSHDHVSFIPDGLHHAGNRRNIAAGENISLDKIHIANGIIIGLIANRD